VRVLITGATGFVGRWLIRDLEAAGHDAVAAPPSASLDVTDATSLAQLVRTTHPDAIAHLAAVSYGPDARRDPRRAMAVNEGGTVAILAAAATVASPIPVLVVSSAEVYGHPAADDLPLRESAPLLAEQPYGQSKLAAEAAAFAAAAGRLPIVVVRPFNHTGPGQRPEFVVPALARRIVAAWSAGNRSIAAGNVDVRRDFTDVRDVVRAYRLILESFRTSPELTRPRVYNIASGQAVAIRDIARSFAVLAGIEIDIEIDPSLVRTRDPVEIRGDASLIGAELGWHPTIALDVTLRDVFEDAIAQGTIPQV
jgi:GDP-4-dehydro-6-deoxy-D-mannose reductase